VDEASLTLDPDGDPADREAALQRVIQALRFELLQVREVNAMLIDRVARHRLVLLDAGLAVAREGHRGETQLERARWMVVLREINELLR